MHFYEVRPRKDNRGVDLISDVLPFGRLRYGDANAISNADRLRQVSQPVHIILRRSVKWLVHRIVSQVEKKRVLSRGD
jgi:hypothetical protein